MNKSRFDLIAEKGTLGFTQIAKLDKSYIWYLTTFKALLVILYYISIRYEKGVNFNFVQITQRF